MFILFIGLIFSTSLYSMESVDRLQSKILKIYDKNVIVLNRGLEDDIEVGDHGKITNVDEGFIARGICLKRGMYSSHWKIYRIVRPGLVSRDLNYYLSSINQSEIPEDIKEKYGKKNHEKKFSDWNEKDLNKSLKLQQERLVKTDLPASNKNDPFYLESKKGSGTKFIEKNFNMNKFKDDLKNYHFSLYASPFSVESFNNQKNLNYGFTSKSLGDKYQLAVGFDKRERKFVDPIKKEVFAENEEKINASFNVKRVTPEVDLFINAESYKKTYQENSLPANRLRIIPIGMTYYFIQDESKKRTLALSYAPIIEKREDLVNGIKTSDSLTRHFIKGEFKTELSKKVSLDTHYIMRQNLENASDVDNELKIGLSYEMGKSFYADFNYLFIDDYYLGLNSGLSSKNNIYTFNFRYDFDL